MALGATVGKTVRTILWEGLKLSLAGISAGVVLAAGVSQLLSSFLYQVRASDPWVLGSASLLLLTVTLLACYIPARRAAKVDPMVALRSE